MSKQTLDTDHITNELEQSAFFKKAHAVRRKASPQPVKDANTPQNDKSSPAEERTPVNSRSLAAESFAAPEHNDRRFKRHAFDIWVDQLQRLRLLKRTINDRLAHDDTSDISMAIMVREAIDEYIESRSRDI